MKSKQSFASSHVQTVHPEEEEDKCIICLDSDPNAKMRGCNHSYTCRDCTEDLILHDDPCPVCRKPFTRFDVGKWSSGVGELGVWPASLENLTQLASSEGFNEYFQDLFVGNETSYLRWKEVFDVLDIHGPGIFGPSMPLLQQVLRIMKSKDLMILRAWRSCAVRSSSTTRRS